MAKSQKLTSGRFKKIRVVLQGKFLYSDRELLTSLLEGHGASVAKDLGPSTTHLVVPELSSCMTAQKSALALCKKGAAIEIMDAATFLEWIRPTQQELTALLNAGPSAAKTFKLLAPNIIKYNHHGAQKESPRLSGINFDKLDLSAFDLKGVAFESCSFVGAKLDKTQFVEAIDCDFSNSTGDSPSFEKVDGSRFAKAKYHNATFCSHFQGCDFTEADLDHASFSESFWGARMTSSNYSEGPCFAKASLRGCKFYCLHDVNASFCDADLSSASFNSCSLDGSLFQNANARDALLVATSLRKADFTNASLQGANLAEADLSDALIDGADFTEANLRGAKVDATLLAKQKGVSLQSTVCGTVGPALKELDAICNSANLVQITFHVGRDDGSEGLEIQIRAYSTSAHLFVPATANTVSPTPLGLVRLSTEMLQAGRVFGHLPVRFETLHVKSVKASKSGKALHELTTRGIAEAFAQLVPNIDDPAAAAFRKKQQEKARIERERREQLRVEAETQKKKATQQIAKKIEKAVGQVSDVATFLKALELRIEKPKIDKATKMLKASSFKLFNNVTEEQVSGIVKSQTDAELVYACCVTQDGQYMCCTQNLNVCGGLRGSLCKHLLVLIIGLVQSGELDPKTIDQWIAKTSSRKSELDKEKMTEVYLKYKGAEAGELDWRPTETLPEDYYTL